MNKNSWKMRCVDGGNSRWEVGSIIVVKDNKGTQGEYCVDGDFSSFNNWCEERKRLGSKWELIEDSFTKSDLQECDVVIFRNKERLVYFGNQFMYEGCGYRSLYAYKENLKRSDFEKQFDVMQVYRNGQLIFNREEKSQAQIEVDKIKSTINDLNKQVEQLEKEVR